MNKMIKLFTRYLWDSKSLLKKQNRLIFIVSLLIWTPSLNAQELNHKTQIIEYLGLEKFNSISQSNPAYLKFLDVRLSNGHLIVDYVEDKMEGFSVLNVIYHTEWKTVEKNGKSRDEIVQTKITPEEFLIRMEDEDFNFLEYKFAFDRKEVVYHVLGNTGKVIVMLSTERINDIINKEN